MSMGMEPEADQSSRADSLSAWSSKQLDYKTVAVAVIYAPTVDLYPPHFAMARPKPVPPASVA